MILLLFFDRWRTRNLRSSEAVVVFLKEVQSEFSRAPFRIKNDLEDSDVCMGRKESGAPGFTLEELLIVIGIIVVFGLLLPTLIQARIASQRAVCQNNLKEISLGILSRIAPTYILSDLPSYRYAAQAIQLLPEKERASERERLLKRILQTRDEDGTWNDLAYEKSRSYGTAAVILALLGDKIPLPPKLTKK